MADENQLSILRQGAEAWNEWRMKPRPVEFNLTDAILDGADLTNANLSDTNLHGADLTKAKLTGARLYRAYLCDAKLTGADLTGAMLNRAYLDDACLTGANLNGARLYKADLSGANLTDADLTRADLTGADLTRANLNRADLTDADLTGARLVETKLCGAKLHGCRIYGLSTWDADLTGAEQAGLIITPAYQSTITVDNLKVAQFVYLLLNNPEVREVIDTITSKAVLILGRFTPERKQTLEAIHVALRQRGYVPIIFDFHKPASVGFMETVSILASMARFVLADLTDGKVLLAELYQLVERHPSKPVQPLLLKGKPLNLLDYDFSLHRSYLPVYEYEAEGNLLKTLLETLTENVIAPAECMIEEERRRVA